MHHVYAGPNFSWNFNNHMPPPAPVAAPAMDSDAVMQPAPASTDCLHNGLTVGPSIASSCSSKQQQDHLPAAAAAGGSDMEESLLHRQLQKLHKQVKQLQSQNTDLRSRLKAAESGKAAAQAALQRAQQQARSTSQQLRDSRRAKQVVDHELHETQQLLLSVQAQNSDLQAEKAAMEVVLDLCMEQLSGQQPEQHHQHQQQEPARLGQPQAVNKPAAGQLQGRSSWMVDSMPAAATAAAVRAAEPRTVMTAGGGQPGPRNKGVQAPAGFSRQLSARVQHIDGRLLAKGQQSGPVQAHVAPPQVTANITAAAGLQHMPAMCRMAGDGDKGSETAGARTIASASASAPAIQAAQLLPFDIAHLPLEDVVGSDHLHIDGLIPPLSPADIGF